MSSLVRSREVQKLKVMRTEDGQVSGCLQCSVELAFGGHAALSFEDCLLGIPVAEVLNPLQGTFLADEVQRLMRIGVATWLEVELCADRLAGVVRPDLDSDWDAHFRLPLASGRSCDLHVGVPASTAPEQVRDAALEMVVRWSAALDRRAPDSVLIDILAELDLRDAPRLHCGLARVSPERLDAI
ncbi:hypothetical protein D9M68_548850 [compost metagenome]